MIEGMRNDFSDVSTANKVAMEAPGKKIDEIKKDVPRNEVRKEDKSTQSKSIEPDLEQKEAVTKEKEIKKKPSVKKPKNSSKTVAWVGTSISKVLDRNKFEEDNNVKLGNPVENAGFYHLIVFNINRKKLE